MSATDLAVYRECPPVVDTVFTVEPEQSPVEAIVDAMTAATDVNPLETTPLYEYVDADALNSLFHHDASKNAEILLHFTIETWKIFFRTDGRIRVCDATQTTSPEPVFE